MTRVQERIQASQLKRLLPQGRLPVPGSWRSQEYPQLLDAAALVHLFEQALALVDVLHEIESQDVGELDGTRASATSISKALSQAGFV